VPIALQTLTEGRAVRKFFSVLRLQERLLDTLAGAFSENAGRNPDTNMQVNASLGMKQL
jgi:hypothetical protein